MTIDQVRQIFDFITNKHQLGSVSADEFNILVNQASRDYQDFLIGHIEQYQYGRPVPRVGIFLSEEITSKLSPFKKDTVNITVTGSQVLKPPSIRRETAMRTPENKIIRRVEDDRLFSVLNSVIDPVADNPVYVEYDKHFKVYPSTLTHVLLDYYILVPQITWGFTVTDERELYNAGTSTDWVWKDSEASAVIGRMLKPFGVSIKDSELVQYSNQIITSGE